MRQRRGFQELRVFFLQPQKQAEVTAPVPLDYSLVRPRTEHPAQPGEPTVHRNCEMVNVGGFKPLSLWEFVRRQ